MIHAYDSDKGVNIYGKYKIIGKQYMYLILLHSQCMSIMHINIM